ncbi:hypothetical protein N9C56_16170, partial [Paracoccaceae bacterium]|nr:hypothetical protein [Paracoccaceae bacterium]
MSDEEKYWTIVKTRVHQELRALVHLRNQNIEAFMPFRNFEVRQARKTKKKKKAIFPGYIFVKLQERNFGKLNSTRGISYVLMGMEGRPAILSDQFISDTQKILKEKQTELQLLKVENTKTLKKLDIKTELLKKSSIQVKQSEREIEDLRRLATNLREEKSQKISTLQSQLLAVTDQNHNLEETQGELQLQYNLSLKEINLLRKNKENLEQQVSKEKQATFALLSNLNKANSEIKAIREKLERVRSDSQKREVVAQQKELENINELRDLEAQKVLLIQEV